MSQRQVSNMTIDNDLLSIQEARTLTARAKEAVSEFKHFTQPEVDAIVRTMAEAGYNESERLGKMAAEETGFGKWQDKRIKNIFGTKHTWESIKDLKTVGIVNSLHNGTVLEIAEPMGVVAALIPCTNPTSTAMFKAIIALKGRNAIVASPHPRSILCTQEALRILCDAAEKAGAPKGLIHCMEHVSLEGTQELMKNKNTSIILATGSTPMVRAAQSVGKPAYGVGSGNVPAFIERSANVRKSVADVMTGKKFDNGTLCSTEASVIVDAPILDTVRRQMQELNGFFCEGADKDKLRSTLFPDGKMNSDLVGKPATFIAQIAGITCPSTTEVLITEIDAVGRQEPLSKEKLSPVLSMFTADGWRDGCHRCIELLEFGGIGHTMVIHSTDKDIIMKFALEKPAQRIIVNSVGALGAVGYTNDLDPSMTLGPGTIGGSVVSENVTARHLLNIKRVAFETVAMNDDNGKAISQETELKWNTAKTTPTSGTKTGPANGRKSWSEEIDERIRLKAGNALHDSYSKQRISPSKTPEPKRSGKIYGSGISEEDVQKIISQFKIQ